MAAPPTLAWYRSFYWRIGVTFVAFVVVLLITQGLILSQIISEEDAQDQYRAPVLAAEVAADVASVLARDPAADLGAHLRSHYPPEEARRFIFVALPGGRLFSSTTDDIPENIRLMALSALGERPLQFSDAVRPITTTPIVVGRQFAGVVLVLVLQSRPDGISHELGRLLSLPSTLLLIVAAVVVALVVFNPARRRLAALEHAAHRLGEGDLSARAPHDGGDEIARVAAAFNRMAGELESRDAALRTSDALRRQMMADVSHELKTPLTAMRGYIETLRMPEVALDAGRRDRYFETIDRETRRLERIVKDLLDLARYEHGGVVLQPRLFDIERLFDNVAKRHEREAHGKSVAMATHVDPLADQVMADPDRIEQAIENLVANALRHTPPGGTITLRATRTDGAATLSVADTGSGIAPEHLPHVFERFYKVDASRAAESTGSGLGLSITKAIVERHGGTISVTSRPGQTTFTVVLPQSY
ncbi:MAG TPA: HAMP domain-containing sensor histidine kinase [Vicinamibacterales bacterium]|nr:HAMP domain-containing sensor histidine kinase [Vicinamibacterales bacterium]